MKSSEIMKKYNIVPNKNLGQNFLINDAILEKIASFIDISGRSIVEIGPGYGALTEQILAKKPKNLELVELDSKMVEILKLRVESSELDVEDTEFRIINQDVLKYEPSNDDYSVIANIPYYITSPILFHFFYEVKNRPEEMMILMQKDVGDKILKKSGNKSSVLSLYIELACEEIKEVTKVSAGNFIPMPKVESSVLYFKLKKDFDLNKSLKTLEIIKKGFSERRKKLISNLSSRGIDKSVLTDIFSLHSLSDNIRAEELSLDLWKKISEVL